MSAPVRVRASLKSRLQAGALLSIALMLVDAFVFRGSALAQSLPGQSKYTLSAGDVISVRVFGEDEFTRDKIRLTDAGTVSLPVLGEILVRGQTTSEVESLVSDKLRGKILVNPRVTVWIDEYRPVYVNGMVERPGAYSFQPGLSVRKAVAIAGGFNRRASQQKISVVRENDPRQVKVRIDLDAEIGPGDAIIIEESLF